jgi:hypothetical protein
MGDFGVDELAEMGDVDKLHQKRILGGLGGWNASGVPGCGRIPWAVGSGELCSARPGCVCIGSTSAQLTCHMVVVDQCERPGSMRKQWAVDKMANGALERVLQKSGKRHGFKKKQLQLLCV